MAGARPADASRALVDLEAQRRRIDAVRRERVVQIVVEPAEQLAGSERRGLAELPRDLAVEPVDADALQRWYLRLKDAWRRAFREERAIVNPLETATLRWRT